MNKRRCQPTIRPSLQIFAFRRILAQAKPGRILRREVASKIATWGDRRPLPSWTSQAVAALGPAQAELLGRLTSELRMKRVWREFGRRRSDGAPLYPVEAPKLLLMEVLKLTKERAYVIPRRDAR